MSTLTAPVRLTVRRFGETGRRDAWWIQPLVVFLGLVDLPRLRDVGGVPGRALHATGRISRRSTLRKSSARRRTAGSDPGRRPGPPGCRFRRRCSSCRSPAFFRLTCYYYRGAYYKAFWADPPSCTVGEPRSSYWGENSFPLILQNVHRYMLFLSLGGAADPRLRRVEGDLVHRSGDRSRVVRHRPRHTRPGDEHRAARRISVRLPFAAARRRRLRRRAVARAARSDRRIRA